MCGIAGFINFEKKLAKSKLKSYVMKMSQSLKRRGPDASGHWCDEEFSIAISHRRLSIIDLSKKANQPMISGNQRFLIVYNGELYNFQKIKLDLEKNGCVFKTNSDTEVLLELISEYGIYSAIKLLNGMFGFAIWDQKIKKLFIVRDRVGIKPIYVYFDKKNLSFASELKAFFELPWLDLEIDRHSVATYTRLNYIPSPHSIYKNVFKLKPGSILEIDMTKKMKITEFWSLKLNANEKFKNGQFDTYKILNDAVKSQMIADVPIGVFLSGGIDSSLIAAIAQKNSNTKINSFTIGFQESDYDEAVYAKQVSQHLGTNHNEVYFDYSSIGTLLDQIPTVYDEPFADSSQLPTILLSQITKQSVTVALSGDGGDELFGGYYRYFLAEKYNKYIFSQPRFLKHLLKNLIRILPVKFWNNLGLLLPNYFGGIQLGDKLMKLSNLLGNPDETAFQKRIISNYDELSQILYSPNEKSTNYFNRNYENKYENIIERMQILDFLTYLPDDILTKVDRASMYNSLEVRVPFLDNDVIQHAFLLTLEKKIKKGAGKLVLKDILRNFLPENLINRPKMGFGIPLDKILINTFADKIEYYLNLKEVENQKIFKLDYYRKLWKQHKNKERNWQFQLWNFLVFQIWFEKWHLHRNR